jgi:hypothetical protein
VYDPIVSGLVAQFKQFLDDQNRFSFVVASTLERRSEFLEMAGCLYLIHDQSLGHEMSWLNAWYFTEPNQYCLHGYVTRLLGQEFLLSGYLNLARMHLYAWLGDGLCQKASYDGAGWVPRVTFVQEVFIFLHEIAHCLIAGAQFVKEGQQSMVELLRMPERIDLARQYFKSWEMAEELVELYINDPEVHEELFCDHYGYMYTFYWLTTAGEFLRIDPNFFPAIMAMAIQNVHFLHHIRNTITCAIARYEGEGEEELRSRQAKYMQRYFVRKFFMWAMLYGGFPGPANTATIKRMRVQSKSILENLDKLSLEVFPNLDKLAFGMTSQNLSELNEMQDIPRLGAFNRKFSVMNDEEAKYRENLLNLVPEKYILSYTNLAFGRHPLEPSRRRGSQRKRSSGAPPEWLKPFIPDKSSLLQTTRPEE